MFVDKYYDNSLFHIINADKKNRKLIIDFIKSLPLDMVSNMRFDVYNYRQCKEKFYSGLGVYNCFKGNDDELYSYQISYNGDLILKKSILNNGYYDDVFGISLYGIPNMNSVNIFYDNYIGSVKNNIKVEYRFNNDREPLMSCDESIYFIVKLPFGVLYLCYDDIDYCKKFRINYSLNNSFDDFDIDLLDNLFYRKKLFLKY